MENLFQEFLIKGVLEKEFELNDATLDPRPDSETLIESVIEYYPKIRIFKNY